jgi:hypothetical protein
MLWLGEALLAPVPHRYRVYGLPKRLRIYVHWRRKLLGDLVGAHAARRPGAMSNEGDRGLRRAATRGGAEGLALNGLY